MTPNTSAATASLPPSTVTGMPAPSDAAADASRTPTDAAADIDADPDADVDADPDADVDADVDADADPDADVDADPDADVDADRRGESNSLNGANHIRGGGRAASASAAVGGPTVRPTLQTPCSASLVAKQLLHLRNSPQSRDNSWCYRRALSKRVIDPGSDPPTQLLSGTHRFAVSARARGRAWDYPVQWGGRVPPKPRAVAPECRQAP